MFEGLQALREMSISTPVHVVVTDFLGMPSDTTQHDAQTAALLATLKRASPASVDSLITLLPGSLTTSIRTRLGSCSRSTNAFVGRCRSRR